MITAIMGDGPSTCDPHSWLELQKASESSRMDIFTKRYVHNYTPFELIVPISISAITRAFWCTYTRIK
jgi:hypothetical protein